MKVLYVDDTNSNRFLFNVMFVKYFGLTLAESTEEALHLLARISLVQVVVSDCIMPNIDGG